MEHVPPRATQALDKVLLVVAVECQSHSFVYMVTDMVVLSLAIVMVVGWCC